MREQPHYTDLLTKEFFELYYKQKRMSFPDIKKMLDEQGCNIVISTIYGYAKKFGIGRSVAAGRADLDYSKTFITEELIEAFDGALLGDAGVSSKSSAPSARIGCGVEHEDFCEYMMNYFKIYQSSCKKVDARSMNQGFMWSGTTKHHPDIQKQYLRWYPEINGKRTKQPPNDVRITPKSVMLWYLGDGSLYANNKENTISIQLSTDSFLPEKVRFLANKLNSISIHCHRTNDNRIRISSKGIPAFFNFIGDKSPIKCYDYKFDRVPIWRFSSKRMSEVANDLDISYNRLSHLVKIGKIDCYRAGEKGRPRLLPEHIEQAKKLKLEGQLY